MTAEQWLLGGCLGLAALLRLATLTSQSFWFDEAQLAHEVGGSLGQLWHAIGRQEFSPPLYFLLAWGWAKLFGAGALALRLLSALLGIATVALAYACGRELVSRRAGLVAALLTALSPFMVWYSQEAREYMLLGALSAASVYGFARVWRRPGRRELWLWALASALALLTHFFAVFLIVPEALLLLLRHRSPRVALAVALPAAVGVALVPLAVSDMDHPATWLTALPLKARAQQVPVALALNTLYRTTTGWTGVLVAVGVTAGLIVLLLGAAPERQLRGAGVAAGLAGSVILAPLLIALAGHDFFIARALMPAWVPLAVVVAAATTVPRWRAAAVALGAVFLAGFVVAGARIASDRALQRPDWRGVARALGAAPTGRLVLAYDGSLALDPLALYLPRADWRPPDGPVAVGELALVSDGLPRPARAPAGVRFLGRRRVAGFSVDRFALRPGWRGSAAVLAARGGALLQPAPSAPAVIVQRPAG